MAGRDMRGERDWSDSNRVAIRKHMAYAHAGVTADPGPPKGSPRQQRRAVIDTAGREDGGARFAGPELGARRLLERGQPAGVIVVRVRVQKHFYIFDVEPQLRDAVDDHGRCARISPVNQDVAFRSSEQEGRGVVCTDVIDVASNTERFGRLLPAALPRGLPCPEKEHDRNNGRHEQNDAYAAPSELSQRFPAMHCHRRQHLITNNFTIQSLGDQGKCVSRPGH